MTREIKKVVVIGTGVIGASWCAFFLAKGLDVVATDIAPDAKASLDAYIKAAWPALEELGLSAGASLDRLTFTNSLDIALTDADLVQECGPERLDFKQDLYRHLDQILPPDVIIASSSSGLTMTGIQAKCERHPERCVIGHPFNPPHIVPLVEVVGGTQTSEETITRAMAFYAALDKKPIRIFKALPGHVANRLQAALYKEMLYLIQQGVLSVEDADVAVSYGPGLRWGVMGQSLQWHLGGGVGGIGHFMDHLMVPLQGLMKDLREPTVDDALKQKVVAGVMSQLKGRSVDELADAENRVIIGALALRRKVGLA
jgi:carnitine 3-dehydrogenase